MFELNIKNAEDCKQYLKEIYYKNYQEEIEKEIIEEIDNYIIEVVVERIFSRNGGIKHDYLNFCINSDFNWIREEVENELIYLPEELGFEEYDNCDNICDYLKEVKSLLFEIINEIEENTSTDNIYDYIINEVEHRKAFSEKEIFENLEKELIEKRVFRNKEDLEKNEFYIKAKNYITHKKSEKIKTGGQKKSRRTLREEEKKLKKRLREEEKKNKRRFIEEEIKEENEEELKEEMFRKQEKFKNLYISTMNRSEGELKRYAKEELKEEIKKMATEIKATKIKKHKYPYFLSLYFHIYKIGEQNKIENEFLNFINDIGGFYTSINNNGFEVHFQSEEIENINFIKIDINNINLIKDCFDKAMSIRKVIKEFDDYFLSIFTFKNNSNSTFQKELKELRKIEKSFEELKELGKIYKSLEENFYKDLDMLIKYKLENNEIF